MNEVGIVTSLRTWCRSIISKSSLLTLQTQKQLEHCKTSIGTSYLKRHISMGTGLIQHSTYRLARIRSIWVIFLPWTLDIWLKQSTNSVHWGICTVLELTNTQQCLNNGSGKSADLNSGHNVLYRCRSNERGQNHAVLKVNVPAKIWKCLMFHVNECNAFIFIRLNEEDGVS